jgi:hypothetical protein
MLEIEEILELNQNFPFVCNGQSTDGGIWGRGEKARNTTQADKEDQYYEAVVSSSS